LWKCGIPFFFLRKQTWLLVARLTFSTDVDYDYVCKRKVYTESWTHFRSYKVSKEGSHCCRPGSSFYFLFVLWTFLMNCFLPHHDIGNDILYLCYPAIFLIKLNNILLPIYPTVRLAHWKNMTYSLYLNKVSYASLPLPLATQRFLL
jgi:hypothetical protein